MKTIILKVLTILSIMCISPVTVFANPLKLQSTSTPLYNDQNLSYEIIMYTIPNCWACTKSKDILHEAGLEYKMIPVEGNDELREALSEENGGWRLFPMIFIDGVFFGTYYQLRALYETGALYTLIGLDNPH